MITFIEFNNVGAIGDEVKLSITDAAIIVYTVPAGKKGISFQNVGTKAAWYGGPTTVDPANSRGNKMFMNQTITYKNVKNSFSIGFRCGTGDSTTIAIVNHD